MSKHLLPLSIFALAAAVALHAVAPAQAADAAPLPVECKLAMEKQMGAGVSEGRDKYVTVSNVCVSCARMFHPEPGVLNARQLHALVGRLTSGDAYSKQTVAGAHRR